MQKTTRNSTIFNKKNCMYNELGRKSCNILASAWEWMNFPIDFLNFQN